MHTVVIKREIYDRDPWVAMSLYKAFCAAKERCYRMLLDAGSPKASFAWLQPMIEEEQAIFGKDWYPYGVETNRPTLEALLQYTHEHGLGAARLKVEDLFAPVDAARHSPRRRPAHLKLPLRTEWSDPSAIPARSRPARPRASCPSRPARARP